MIEPQTDRWLAEDREDLLGLLEMRFGRIPLQTVEKIRQIHDSDTLQRLILSAANAADWSIFAEELEAGDRSFKLVGERFSPVRLDERRESVE